MTTAVHVLVVSIYISFDKTVERNCWRLVNALIDVFLLLW